MSKMARYREVEQTMHKPFLLRKAYRYLKNYTLERRAKSSDKMKYDLIGKHYVMRKCI